MKQIFSKKLVDDVPTIGEVKVGGVCEGCQLGKFHRLPFEDSKSRSELSHFLGLEVKKGSVSIFVSQKHYASKLVEKFGLKESKLCSTPLDSNMRLRKGNGKALEDPRLYQTFIGSLQYLTIIRQDIAYSVGVVSQFMQAPRKPHLDAAKRILMFVNFSLDLGLLYKKIAICEFVGFTYADLAGDLDERKSTSGYIFELGSACLSWCSKKQDTMALSSTYGGGIQSGNPYDTRMCMVVDFDW
uniref:Reverse transcriptase Ty1/copia-type domain-containing protein n=1 Tax=Ananas comosus var. bracteatus TaxID=296719 RepID=A0A6V7QL74_ANACO|nr:unnamed protein product [Ananas comosus var. bracteatus]